MSLKYQRRDQLEAKLKEVQQELGRKNDLIELYDTDKRALELENAKLKQQVATLNEAVTNTMTSIQDIRDSWREEILEYKGEN